MERKAMVSGWSLLCLGLAGLLAAECTPDAGPTIALDSSRTYAPQHVKLYEVGDPRGSGFINSMGKIVAPPRVLHEVQMEGFREGRVAVKLADDTPAYLTENGQFIKEPKYMELGGFSEGLASFSQEVSAKRRYGFLDKNGRVHIPPKFIEVGEFHDGLAGAKDENGQ